MVFGSGGGVCPSEKVCGCQMIISMKLNAIGGRSEGPQRWVLALMTNWFKLKVKK